MGSIFAAPWPIEFLSEPFPLLGLAGTHWRGKRYEEASSILPTGFHHRPSCLVSVLVSVWTSGRGDVTYSES